MFNFSYIDNHESQICVLMHHIKQVLLIFTVTYVSTFWGSGRIKHFKPKLQGAFPLEVPFIRDGARLIARRLRLPQKTKCQRGLTSKPTLNFDVVSHSVVT